MSLRPSGLVLALVLAAPLGAAPPLSPTALTPYDARYPGVPVAPYQESGGTDGRHFRAAGIPTYGVGETFIKDSDVFAHGLNERIPVKSFYDGLEHWYVLVREVAGPN